MCVWYSCSTLKEWVWRERPIFRFFDLAREYLKGNEKNEWYHNTSHGFVIFVTAWATGSSPPVKGMATLLKGGMQGR
jgi:hypothetical protein